MGIWGDYGWMSSRLAASFFLPSSFFPPFILLLSVLHGSIANEPAGRENLATKDKELSVCLMFRCIVLCLLSRPLTGALPASSTRRRDWQAHLMILIYTPIPIDLQSDWITALEHLALLDVAFQDLGGCLA